MARRTRATETLRNTVGMIFFFSATQKCCVDELSLWCGWQLEIPTLGPTQYPNPRLLFHLFAKSPEKRFKGKEELPVTGRTFYHQIHHRNFWEKKKKIKSALKKKKKNLILCLSIQMFLYVLFFGSRSFLPFFREIKQITYGKFLRNFKNNLKALCWIFTCPAGKSVPALADFHSKEQK